MRGLAVGRRDLGDHPTAAADDVDVIAGLQIDGRGTTAAREPQLSPDLLEPGYRHVVRSPALLDRHDHDVSVR